MYAILFNIALCSIDLPLFRGRRRYDARRRAFRIATVR
jgi:hypothetical protein